MKLTNIRTSAERRRACASSTSQAVLSTPPDGLGTRLGVSVLFDRDLRITPSQPAAVPEEPCIQSKEEVVEKVVCFKQSLRVTPDKIREIERNTRDQALSPLWYEARFRLTASLFGRILHMLPSTPDSLVQTLLNPKQLSTPAIDWGKEKEPTALSEYTKYYNSLGNTDMVVCRVRFVYMRRLSVPRCVTRCLCT